MMELSIKYVTLNLGLSTQFEPTPLSCHAQSQILDPQSIAYVTKSWNNWTRSKV